MSGAYATDKERKALTLVASGLTTKEASEKIGVAERTVKQWLTDFKQRHNLRNTTQACVFAYHYGVIKGPRT